MPGTALAAASAGPRTARGPSAGDRSTPAASAVRPARRAYRPIMWRAMRGQGSPSLALLALHVARPSRPRSRARSNVGGAGAPRNTLSQPRQLPRVVIGRAADHHAVDRVELRGDLPSVVDAAVEHDGQCREVALQAVHDLVAQRRHLAVLLRAQALQPRIARMHDEDVAARAAATVPTKSRTNS